MSWLVLLSPVVSKGFHFHKVSGETPQAVVILKAVTARVVSRFTAAKRRDTALMIDASKLIEQNDYSPGTRIYLRGEPLCPGAKTSLADIDGNRVTEFLTNSPRCDRAFLDARHRACGLCEKRIKSMKDAEISKLPFTSFAANQKRLIWTCLRGI